MRGASGSAPLGASFFELRSTNSSVFVMTTELARASFRCCSSNLECFRTELEEFLVENGLGMVQHGLEPRLEHLVGKNKTIETKHNVRVSDAVTALMQTRLRPISRVWCILTNTMTMFGKTWCTNSRPAYNQDCVFDRGALTCLLFSMNIGFELTSFFGGNTGFCSIVSIASKSF